MATQSTTVQIVMPSVGESITEGTVLEWLKQVGDTVAEGDAVVEISTDKVDGEVFAPAAGVLTKVLAEADETVTVGQALGEIEAGDPPADAPPDDAPPDDDGGSSGEIVDVTIPEMGDSVVEGTVLEWLVKPGDTVAKDDPLVEVSTDKVDAELPSPVAGTVVELLVKPDETVAVGTVVCRIEVGEGEPGGTQATGQNATGDRGASPGEHPQRQRRPQRHAGGRANGGRARGRHREAERQRGARPRDQGGRRGRARGQRQTGRSGGRWPECHGGPGARAPGSHPDPRPRRHPRPLHGREPLHPHGHELPHPAGGRPVGPPSAAQGGRQEALLHPPHRLGDRAGHPRHARDGALLRRGGGQAPPRDPRRGEPGPGGRRGAQGRLTLARGSRDQGRLEHGLQPVRGRLRRAGGRRARQQAAARRLRGGADHADQPRRHRHRGLRAAADAGPGHDRRHRRHRLSGRPRPGAAREAEGAGRGEGHDDDLDLRPPRDPGRRVGRVPEADRRAAAGRGRLLRRSVRRAGRRDRPRGEPGRR